MIRIRFGPKLSKHNSVYMGVHLITGKHSLAAIAMQIVCTKTNIKFPTCFSCFCFSCIHLPKILVFFRVGKLHFQGGIHIHGCEERHQLIKQAYASATRVCHDIPELIPRAVLKKYQFCFLTFNVEFFNHLLHQITKELVKSTLAPSYI